MTTRTLRLMSGACFVIAIVLVILAIAVGLGAMNINPVFMAVATAILLGITGLMAQQVLGLTDDLGNQKNEKNRLLQAQLEDQRRSVDDLADGLDVAIFILDERATINYVNRRAIEFFRLEQPVGQNILKAAYSFELEQLVIEAAATRKTCQAEIVFTTPDERVGLSTAWYPEGNSGRVFLSVYEITELRRLERIRQDFVANVSHELRTPMALIRAMTETLLDDTPETDELATRYLSKTIAEVDRLSSITQDLLILSAAESNPVRKQVCDIAEVLQNVVDELMAKANEKGLELSYRGEEFFTMEANPAQMKQVALNLIDNAVNYTSTGSVQVSLEHSDDEVLIEISDTGAGIASEHLNRIFERFYRVNKGRSRTTGGTGLGLSIVKHIVEAHGGKVCVTSSLNFGSTFSVRLPIGNIGELAVLDASANRPS